MVEHLPQIPPPERGWGRGTVVGVVGAYLDSSSARSVGQLQSTCLTLRDSREATRVRQEREHTALYLCLVHESS